MSSFAEPGLVGPVGAHVGDSLSGSHVAYPLPAPAWTHPFWPRLIHSGHLGSAAMLVEGSVSQGPPGKEAA